MLKKKSTEFPIESNTLAEDGKRIVASLSMKVTRINDVSYTQSVFPSVTPDWDCCLTFFWRGLNNCLFAHMGHC